METLKKLKLVLGSLVIMVITAQVSVAQTYSLNNTASNLIVEGTSNVHDWEMTAEQMAGKISVEIEDGQLVRINQLDFEVTAESLKSGKGGMDKNTYKALDTDKHKKITYKLDKVDNIDCTSKSRCKVTTSGYLTIAGARNPANITFDAKVSENKLELTGSKSLKMTDFNVDPPTAVFGTIRTGDEVTIKFKTVYTK